MIESIKRLLPKLKNPKFLIILGFAGILLIFLSSLGPSEKEKKNSSSAAYTFSAEDYKVQLEQDITAMVRKITGSKNISVMVTLESGVKYSYAESAEGVTEQKSEKDTESSSEEIKQSYITVKTSDGGEDALLVTEIMPEIRGVAIVCDGGDDEFTREKIKNAVMAALNITSKRVYIAGGATYEN
ncbi:MAG: hypothetical protein II317_02835 [Clostridia bacterium]|nr:hypothetical protein [Clostridia bacterium]